jgi:hypothetical protein
MRYSQEYDICWKDLYVVELIMSMCFRLTISFSPGKGMSAAFQQCGYVIWKNVPSVCLSLAKFLMWQDVFEYPSIGISASA